MKRILLLTSALATAMIVAASMASAAITAESVLADLSAQGYSRIEIKTGLTQIKAEAISGTTKLEVIYDIATGQVLKSETGAVGIFDDTTPGVELSDRDRDFVRVASSDDNLGDDNGDNDNSDDGQDHDSNDDRGNDGEGHDGGDDHGSDNSGHGSDD